MVKTKVMKNKMERTEGGGVLAMIALIISVVSFVLWAFYVPFTFLHEIVAIVCLVLVLPVCLFLIIAGLILSLISLNIGAGKRTATAVIAMLFCILQVILWVGWIILGILWNLNYLD